MLGGLVAGGLSLLALLTLAAAGASASVIASQSGWRWGSPQPQGETLRAIDFSGEHGYAVGDFGTLLRTEDGGRSWRGAAAGTTERLELVKAIDEDSVVTAGGCAVRRSDNRGRSFRRLAWSATELACEASPVSIGFPSDRAGYLLLEDGSVLATGDGGKTWLARSPVPGSRAAGGADSPSALAFGSDAGGFVVTGGGKIYATGDGAQSWSLRESQPRALRAALLSGQTGYALGDGGSFLTSADGGSTWSPKDSGSPSSLRSISCVDARRCLATVGSGEALLLTHDGGETFAEVDPGPEQIWGAAFSSTQLAVAAGARGAMAISNDGGLSWRPMGTSLRESFGHLRAVSNSVAFAAGQGGAIAKTTDGGLSWTGLRASPGQDVVDLSFRGERIGYVIGSRGVVLRTVDGGTSWRVVRDRGRAPQAVAALARGVVLLVGGRGILRSRDRGRAFRRVRGRLVARTKLFGVDRAGRAIFAYGSKSIIVSRDRGRTWAKVLRPRKALLAAVDFVTGSRGFALGQDGRLWTTRNRGRRWRELAGVGTDEGVGLSFGSRWRGYIVLKSFGETRGGFVLRTGDGGRTWRPQLLDSATLAPDGVATSRYTDFALTGSSSLLFTDRGGDRGRHSRLTISTPRKRVRKSSVVNVRGAVRGAETGASVLVSRRMRGDTGWQHQVATVGRGRTFQTRWKVRRTSVFVAQWLGDVDSAGDGSPPLVVRAVRSRRSSP